LETYVPFFGNLTMVHDEKPQKPAETNRNQQKPMIILGKFPGFQVPGFREPRNWWKLLKTWKRNARFADVAVTIESNSY